MAEIKDIKFVCPRGGYRDDHGQKNHVLLDDCEAYCDRYYECDTVAEVNDIIARLNDGGVIIDG